MDDKPENDITFMEEALGAMPAPTLRVFDIFLQEKTPYNVVPNRYLYDDNAGRGYTEEQANVRVTELKAMGTGNLTFTKRLRTMPKAEDPPKWTEEFTGKDEHGEFLF